MQNFSEPAFRVKHRGLTMASLLLGAFVGMFSETSLNIALPKLMIVFHTSTAVLQWLVTGYMLVIGIVLPLSSLIAKWFTTRQIVIFALLDFIIGAAISALAPNFAVLLAGRMIQGIGTGLILPLMFTIVMQIFPPKKIGSIMGICALVIMFAPAIGPTLTGLILAKLSWRWIFWSFEIFLVIALCLAVTALENIGQPTRPHIDLLSIIESVLGFSGLVIGASLSSLDGWGSWPVLGSFAVGILVLIAYVIRQLKLETPILNLRVFKVKAFTIGAVLVMLDFGIILSAMYLMPMYLQNGLLLAVALTGIVMLPGGLVNALVSAFAGRMYDSIGAKRPVMIGFVIAIVGIVMLLLTTAHSAVAYVIAAHVILMIGCPLAMSPAQTSALNALRGPASSDGSTILNTMQQIVGALATALATSFLELGRHAAAGSQAMRFTSGVHTGLYFTLALAIIALIVSFALPKQSED